MYVHRLRRRGRVSSRATKKIKRERLSAFLRPPPPSPRVRPDSFSLSQGLLNFYSGAADATLQADAHMHTHDLLQLHTHTHTHTLTHTKDSLTLPIEITLKDLNIQMIVKTLNQLRVGLRLTIQTLFYCDLF
jgi:hypothetical protein